MSDNETKPDIAPAASAQVKLPTFSAIDAHTWFRRAEVQFRLKKLTSPTTKADHVLAALPEELFPRISEWLFSKGDAAIQYDDLKTYLLQRFTPSATSRVTQLLQLAKQPLGDQRSSDALLEIKVLARLLSAADGSARRLDLPRALWLLRLPEHIRAAIPDAEMNEAELQRMADRLKDSHAAAAQQVNTASLPGEADIAVITRTPSRPEMPKRQHQGSGRFIDRLYYFHARFGPAARNCKPGCPWPKNV